MTRRVMQVGDVIKVTHMPTYSFPHFKPPLYALAIEKVPEHDDPDYHKLLIVEGGYGTRDDPEVRVAGMTFNLHGKPKGKKDSCDWVIVPPQSVPNRIWVEIAKWSLLR